MAKVFTDQLISLLIEHVTQTENGIAALDSNDRFIFFNDAFTSMFGLQGYLKLGHTFDDMLTQMFTQGVGPNSRASTLKDWLEYVHFQYRTKPFRSFEVDLVNGHWVLMTEQVNANGEVVLVSNDITRAKKTELELEAARAILERQALTDELTGISNRRHFMMLLHSEYHRTRRYDRCTALAILDIDHFKKINDIYGHPVGDEVLCHFTHLLQMQLRKQDVVGRLGGEEFAILLPETAEAEAVVLIERIIKELKLVNLDTIAPGFNYTFSAGVAELTAKNMTSIENWISVTDKALYQAKTSGRDRVMIYNPTLK
ncbi:diguanylate cyclase [Shewanella profunda]|uniref:sensor domain-containing diguanylate cyclase n=1 Tax=Shewanella profunda TaxID=254793 RepID=UPI00200D452F|nr:sensor domain-containing diguanylate cyclase [Shewanella profunda]MCL1089113.1 diguanylate cyclase [Shewanella profunda]